MKLDYDPEADAAYIRLRDRPVVRTEEESDVCILDFDAEGSLAAIELLSVFGFAGASLRAVARRGLLSTGEVDELLAGLRREAVAA